jgi:acyl-CoA reductase-like NAD-dependent aldehyde dehydrogenase
MAHRKMAIGGYKQSGVGCELGRHGFDQYSELKGVGARII